MVNMPGRSASEVWSIERGTCGTKYEYYGDRISRRAISSIHWLARSFRFSFRARFSSSNYTIALLADREQVGPYCICPVAEKRDKRQGSWGRRERKESRKERRGNEVNRWVESPRNSFPFSRGIKTGQTSTSNYPRRSDFLSAVLCFAQ